MLEAMQKMTSALKTRVEEFEAQHVGLVLWACT